MSPTDRRRDVLDSLGRAIVTGEMTPGQSLTLEAIQSRYGVSRTLARDCVHALESVGVVTSRRRVGIVVLPREHWSALAPQLVRWQLEADPQPSSRSPRRRPPAEPPRTSALACWRWLP